MTDLRTPLTRAEVTEIRDEAIERPRLAHGSMKVRDLADTALGLMDRDDERKTIIDDALASSLERAEARIVRLEVALRTLADIQGHWHLLPIGHPDAEERQMVASSVVRNIAQTALGEPQEDNP